MKSDCVLTAFLTNRSRTFYVFAIAGCVCVSLLLGILAFSYCQVQSLNLDLDRTGNTYQFNERLLFSFEKTIEAEARVRGFGLTGNKEFVRNYPELKKQIWFSLDSLAVSASDASASVATNEQLERQQLERQQLESYQQLVRLRLSLLDTVLTRKGYNFANVEIKNAFLDRCQLVMGQIRTIKDNLYKQQRQVLEHQKQKARRTLGYSLGLILVVAFILVVAGTMVLQMIYKYVTKHQQAERYQRELNEQKNTFFSILSHDLRGPVHASHTLLSIMDEQYATLSEDDKQLMRQTTLKTLGQTGSLLESLLAWSKTQMNHTQFAPENVRFLDLITQVLEWKQPLAEAKKIELSARVDSDLYAHIDPAMFEVVLRNLISNAVKFTPPGGSIQVDARQTAKSLQITVADTGVGMSEEVRQKIFRIDTKHTTIGTGGEKGSGLGLTLCRQYVEKHGGSIQVSSQEGKGSRFQIFLPKVVAA